MSNPKFIKLNKKTKCDDSYFTKSISVEGFLVVMYALGHLFENFEFEL